MMPINHAAMNSIYPCRTQKEQKLFERLPEIFHGRDQAFIPPFPGSIVKYLSKTSAFNRLYGEIHPFLAWRDGKPVGRIAAIINRAHNERYRHSNLPSGTARVATLSSMLLMPRGKPLGVERISSADIQVRTGLPAYPAH
jgi:hypothetical protein